MGIEQLNNKGIQYIGNPEAVLSKEKTLIVVGVARGGTSLIAGTLDKLGIFTGEGSHQPIFEDARLATAFENSNFESAKETIVEYNSHETWLFKRPSSLKYLNKIDTLVRNPVYLIVFKDIFSVSNRNSISMKTDIVGGLRKAYGDYEKILNFIEKSSPNAFLFSYEKLMGNKEFFIDTMIELVGGEVTAKQKNDALLFIEPNPESYLDASRITKSIGQIGSVKKNLIIGWAKYAHSNKEATVQLYINSVLVASKKANDFRQHTLDKKIHKTGYCGYVFELKDKPLKDGDIVSVKLEDEVVFLNGSNYKYKEK